MKYEQKVKVEKDHFFENENEFYILMQIRTCGHKMIYILLTYYTILNNK